MRALVIEPMREPYVKEIKNGLEPLQEAVGGFIEAVYPYEESVAIICNEEGKLNGLPLNRALRGEDGEIYDILAGTVLVVGLGDENFTGLSDELIKQFSEKFKTPEQFVRMGGHIMALPVAPPKPKLEKPSVMESLKTHAETPPPRMAHAIRNDKDVER